MDSGTGERYGPLNHLAVDDFVADHTNFPDIYVDDQARIVVASAKALLVQANLPPDLFRCGGRLATVEVGPEGPGITHMTNRRLFARLVELGNWIRRETGKPGRPPAAIISAIIEEPPRDLPELEGITSVPVYGRDFRRVDRPGYDSDAKLYFVDSGHLGANPRKSMRIEAALDLLREALQDFPFAEPSSRVHAIALMLLPFVRPALGDCPTPLHVIESPTPGTGKGKLSDLLSIIATGAPARPTSLSSSRAENGKKLTALLASGAPMILLDNLPQDKMLNDPVLASMLTTATPTERLLGSNRMLSMKNRAVWLATANNPSWSPELARRCVLIRLEPQCARPWLRNGFLHPNLLGWALERRADLVSACLAVVENWLAKGRPNWGGQPLGSFETWSSVLGGILQSAGLPGFLENLEQIYAGSDTETEDWHGLTEHWWNEHGSKSVRASDLLPICLEHELLEDLIGFGSQRSQVSRLGRGLRNNTDRMYGDCKIIRERSAVRSSARYKLERLSGA